MELFKSLENRTKTFNDPFKHFEINQPLTEEAIKEICNAVIADPKKENLNYDGTRALDGGDGAFRSGIKEGGKAKKLSDLSINVPSNNYGIIEDLHQSIMHILSQSLRMQNANRKSLSKLIF